MTSLVELFVKVDDFYKEFLPNLQKHLLNSGATIYSGR